MSAAPGERLSLPLPELNRGALVMADLAWIETEGSPADRTRVAIQAYLWSAEIAHRTGWHPSLNELRAVLAAPAGQAEGDRQEDPG